MRHLNPHLLRSAAVAALGSLLFGFDETVASGGLAFAFLGVMMLLQFVMVLLFLPETKGVSLEAIQRQLGIE